MWNCYPSLRNCYSNFRNLEHLSVLCPINHYLIKRYLSINESACYHAFESGRREARLGGRLSRLKRKEVRLKNIWQ